MKTNFIDYFLTPIFYVIAFILFKIIEFEFPKILYFYLIAVAVHFLIKNAFIQIIRFIKGLRS